MLRRVVLVRTDVSEEPGASFITVTRIGELGTTQAATSNRRTLRRNTKVPPKRRFLQEPHGVTSQKTPFFIVTAVKTSDLTKRHCSTKPTVSSHTCSIHFYINQKVLKTSKICPAMSQYRLKQNQEE
jgi:hypothetical protein